MKTIIWVGIGGFIGATSRYILNLGLDKINRYQFPISTFIINFIGCFLLGIAISNGILNMEKSNHREFFVVGILGSFTTFSAFAADSIDLLAMGNIFLVLGYTLGSISAGIIGIWLGKLLVN